MWTMHCRWNIMAIGNRLVWRAWKIRAFRQWWHSARDPNYRTSLAAHYRQMKNTYSNRFTFIGPTLMNPVANTHSVDASTYEKPFNWITLYLQSADLLLRRRKVHVLIIICTYASLSFIRSFRLLIGTHFVVNLWPQQYWQTTFNCIILISSQIFDGSAYRTLQF